MYTIYIYIYIYCINIDEAIIDMIYILQYIIIIVTKVTVMWI